MVNEVGTTNLDIFEVGTVIWRRKILIIAFSLIIGFMGAAASYLLAEIYRGEVLLAPVAGEDTTGRLTALGGGIGGLASLAGFAVPQSNTVHESLAVLRSREFTWQFVRGQNLMPVLFADQWDSKRGNWIDPDEHPTMWDAYFLMSREVVQASLDNDTGLVSLRVEWADPSTAASWANSLVEQLNAYLRQEAIDRSTKNLDYLREELARTQVAEIRQTIFALIGEEQKTAMLANAQKEFAFRVLDAAAEPERRVRPKRLLVALLTTVMAGTLATMVVIGRFAYERRLSRLSDSLK